jgi:hypothetical protein
LSDGSKGLTAGNFTDFIRRSTMRRYSLGIGMVNNRSAALSEWRQLCSA